MCGRIRCLMQSVLVSEGMETRFCRRAHSFFLVCYEILVLSMKIKSANKDWCDL